LAGDADRLARFEREARLLASLNHPNIAAIHGLQRADGQLALILEYVPGATLAERLRDDASVHGLPVNEAMKLARAIAEALAAAHRAGVVHRDLKPSNVMVSRSGAKLLDFGVAKAVHADGVQRGTDALASGEPLTEDGVVVGTARYMAPEQLRAAVADHRTDIFAFGVLVYEMLTGQHPFVRSSGADTIAAILELTPPAMTTLRAGLPSQLDRLVQKCLLKDPEERWQNASDIVEALDWVAESLRQPVTTSAVPDQTERLRRGWALLTVGLLASAAVAVVAAVWWRPAPPADATPLEFSIPPAQGTAWSPLPASPNPAVSPDGRYVAVAAQAERDSGVWLHDLQSGTARLLLRTVGGAQPFWAPDSSAIGVCDTGGVSIIGLDSRPPEHITTPGCLNGAWHALSGWLLSGDKGLMRVSPQGGTPEWLTTVDPARGELRHAFGRWLPDGKHFIFLMRAQTAEVRGIYLGSADHTPPSRLLSETSNPVYVTEGNGHGRLLYVRGGTLVAQGFDEQRLALLPEVSPLGQRVRLGIAMRSGAFDASERLLVFRSGAAYQPTRLIWLDRGGRQLGEVGPDEAYRLEASLSPDERTLLYGRYNEDTNLIEVWTSDLERSVATALLKPAGASVEAPLWSPDGKLLAYLSAERGVYIPWLIDRTGTQHVLQWSAAAHRSPYDIAASGVGLDLAWTPDSRYLLRQVDGGVRGFAVDGSDNSIPILKRDVSAQVSPDGRWVAYATADTGQREVYVERVGGGDVRRVSLDTGFSPRWRADGQELFFRATPDRMMAVDVRLGDSIQIGTPHLLFHAPFEPSGLATAGTADYLVTRGGQRFLITVPVVSVKPLTARLNWRSRLGHGADALP
jgi:Tol biopolymer transport system component